jgi:hypothetical protein
VWPLKKLRNVADRNTYRGSDRAVTACGVVAAIVVSEQSVRELADAESFERGRAYFHAGRVRRFAVEGTTVTAVVEGTQRAAGHGSVRRAVVCRPAVHSVLVEVLLWEGHIEAAWQATTTRGCRDQLWLRLARERAAIHPPTRSRSCWPQPTRRSTTRTGARILREELDRAGLP